MLCTESIPHCSTPIRRVCTKNLKSSHANQVRIHIPYHIDDTSHRSMFELWGWGSDYSELETSISQEFPPQRMVCVCVLTVHYVCTGALHTE